jgi:ABC-type nitrate/sulfonate/bicarbonate transport system permease component
MTKLLRIILPPIVVFILAAALTEAFVRWMEIPPFRFPTPSSVFRAILERRESLLPALANTAKAALSRL